MPIYTSIDQAVGRTPLVELRNIEKIYDLKARLFAKVEGVNPGGSVKDRVGVAMVNEAEAAGKLTPGSVIIEPTSGNTGIGLAMVCAARGYRCIIVMPDTMSVERRMILSALGAELVLTPGCEGMNGAIAKAEELSKTIPNAMVAGQFVNPANARAHELTTGPEIWADTEGHVDAFVAGVGTGGTITGTGRYLKSQDPSVQIIGVEPADSPILSGGKAGAHGLQGIGAGFIPEVLDVSLLDEVITVTTEEAYAAGRLLGHKEGILAGISAGAALHAAVLVAQREDLAGKNVVVLLPDTGDRYLSTALFGN
ncbi:MAG: cysteine synthase A [Clostridia bacterium]|nr:cysteine synthase A [Clostridia bacterium]